MLWVPFASADVVMVHAPSRRDARVPTLVVPLKIVTVLPASAVPVKVGVLYVGDVVRAGHAGVRRRVRSGADGAAGATVSMVTAKAADAALRLPALSVAVAVMLWTPSASVVAVMVHFPVVALALAVPITVVPSYRVTVLPGQPCR